LSDGSPAHAKDVHVVVLDALPGEEMIVAIPMRIQLLSYWVSSMPG